MSSTRAWSRLNLRNASCLECAFWVPLKAWKEESAKKEAAEAAEATRTQRGANLLASVAFAAVL